MANETLSEGEGRDNTEDLFAAWTLRVEGGEDLLIEDLLRSNPSDAEELRRLYDDWRLFAPVLGKIVPGLIASDAGFVVPSISPRSDSGEEPPSSELLARLGIHAPNEGRYRFRAVLGRGGGGVVLKVWDTKLNRPLAMKVVLGRSEDPPSGDTPRVGGRALTRFVDEARIASQLNHPGIVPVHELGADATGRAFFTMKLVRGEDLSVVFGRVRTGSDGWNQIRALGMLLRVCEAMAFAHDRGVVHRDLKPSNIMVGRYGEVHVMDWGLARFLGEVDHHDIRVRPDRAAQSSEIDTFRAAERNMSPTSPLMTMDGTVIGTPAYMSPEQARGEIEAIGPRSDIYAIGAMLYELLVGRPPFMSDDSEASPQAVLAHVREAPPQSLGVLAPRAPEELVAICSRAMSRDMSQRYPRMQALADDLRAYLEHRVVSAHQTGTWAETKKWVQRNRALATSIVGLVLLLIVGLTSSLYYKARAETKALELEKSNVDLKEATQAAIKSEMVSTQKANDVLSLSAIQDLKDLEDRADNLWPANPDVIAAYDAWLADARLLIEGQPSDPKKGTTRRPGLAEHVAQLAEIRRRATPFSPEAALRRDEPSGSEPIEAASKYSVQMDDREGDPNERRTFQFENGDDRWWHEQLSKLVVDLKAFTDEKMGGLFSSGTSEKHGWGIVRRREFAASIEERTVTGAEARRRWEEATSAIAASPKYGGLRLTPQLGLLPIGADPDSGLWEFAHVQTGDPVERGADGTFGVTESMTLVFVLIPGGKFWMGAQADPTGRNYDPQTRGDQSPVHRVELSPYFLSKYEMTQGQWLRVTGRNPSFYGPVFNLNGHQHDLCHPVENVSWNDCAEVLRRIGLELPSEAQWENGCRGGAETPWSTGGERESLLGRVNLADRAFASAGGARSFADDWPDFEDGWVVHAPVGAFAPNAFGLHELHGNVWEWCLDGYDSAFYGEQVSKDPRFPGPSQTGSVNRGGSFDSTASWARSAYRNYDLPDHRNDHLGLRPAKGITP